MWNFLFDVVIGTWYDWVVRNVPAPVQAAGCLTLLALVAVLVWMAVA